MTDTLSMHREFVAAGMSEEQADAIVKHIAVARPDPEIATQLQASDRRFDGIETRLDGMDLRLDSMDHRLDGMDRRLDGIDKRLDGMDDRFDRLEATLGVIQQQLGGLSRDLQDIVQEIHDARVERAEIRSQLHVVEERVKMEGRVSRMINATLISLGAIGATLAAVFTG